MMPDAYRIAGNEKKLKELCDREDDGQACLYYALKLRDKGGDQKEKVKYYKKSCDYKNVEGCNLYRSFLDSLETIEIKKMCQNDDYQNCFQGGQVLYDREESEEALPLLEKACQIDFESYACKLRDEIKEDLSTESEV